MIARSPRVVRYLVVDIKNNKGVDISALTENISIGGLAFQCHIDERNQITPQGDFIDDGKPLEVDVRLQLHNLHGHTEIIHARCRVVYSRRVAQDKCQVGLSFIKMFDDGYDKFSAFIESALQQ